VQLDSTEDDAVDIPAFLESKNVDPTVRFKHTCFALAKRTVAENSFSIWVLFKPLISYLRLLQLNCHFVGRYGRTGYFGNICENQKNAFATVR
jgi:hypothetical protein